MPDPEHRDAERPALDAPCAVCGHRYGIHEVARKHCPKVDASPSHEWPWRDKTFRPVVPDTVSTLPTRTCPHCGAPGRYAADALPRVEGSVGGWYWKCGASELDDCTPPLEPTHWALKGDRRSWACRRIEELTNA